MAQTVRLKRSATQGAAPSTSDLALGEVAINTYDGKMYIKKDDGTASIVEIGGPDGAYTKYSYTATASQTTFSVSYAVGYVDVWLNGVKLDSSDFTASNGSSIVLASGATSGDLFEAIAWNIANIQQNAYAKYSYTATSSQTTFAATYTPGFVNVYLNGVLLLDSTEYTATNGTSIVLASGATAGDSVVIEGFATYSTSSLIPSQTGNSGSFLTTDGTNPSWSDTLYDDTANSRIGLGTSSPTHQLHVEGTSTQQIKLKNTTTNTEVRLASSSAGVGFLWTQSSDSLLLGTGGTEYMRINSLGNVGIGTSSPAATLDVDGTVIGSGDVGFGVTSLETTSATRTALTLDNSFFAWGRDSYNEAGVAQGSYRNSAGNDEYRTTGVAVSQLSMSAGTINLQVAASGTNGNTVSWTDGLVVDNSGNVGISNTSPDYQLHVTETNSGGSTNPVVLQNNATAVNTEATLGFVNSTVATSGSGRGEIRVIRTSASGSSDMRFLTSNAGTTGERLRIDSSGNVGIGTSSPSYRLDTQVSATDWVTRILNTNANGAGLLVRTDSTNNNNVLGVYGNGAYRMMVKADGNVGIGTTSPSKNLHVYNATTNRPALIESGDANSLIEFEDNSTTYPPAIGATGDNLVVETGSSSSERMRITSSGNVGIGTTSPSAKLDVQGDVVFNDPSASFTATFSSATGGAYLVLDAANGTHSIQHDGGHFSIYDSSASSERLRLDSSGRLGIGTTSPTQALHIVSPVASDTTFASGGVGTPTIVRLVGTDTYNSGTSGSGISFNGLYNSSGTPTALAGIAGIKENTTDGDYDGALIFMTRTNGQGAGAAENMRIDSSGNVGIGTTSPSYKLDVNGSLNATSLYVNGTAVGTGDITGVTAGNGLTGGATSGNATLNVGAGTGISVAADTVGLATSGVSAGTYGSASAIPAITVDAYGRVTSASTNSFSAGSLTQIATSSYNFTSQAVASLSIGTSAISSYDFLLVIIDGKISRSGSYSDFYLGFNNASGNGYYTGSYGDTDYGVWQSLNGYYGVPIGKVSTNSDGAHIQILLQGRNNTGATYEKDPLIHVASGGGAYGGMVGSYSINRNSFGTSTISSIQVGLPGNNSFNFTGDITVYGVS